MPVDLDDLEAKARAALPGPWEVADVDPDGLTCSIISPSEELDVIPRAPHDDDAHYIAAASPDVILRLVAVAKAAKALADDNSDDPELIALVGEAVDALDAPEKP